MSKHKKSSLLFHIEGTKSVSGWKRPSIVALLTCVLNGPNVMYKRA